MARGLTGCSVLENRIVAEAGTMMSSVAAAAAEAGLTGLEFASGIPGTVGGGVLMNAGAALYIGQKAPDIGEGVKLAAELIDSGAAMRTLEKVIEVSHS